MSDLLRLVKEKHGISVMVGYVLLIVIAVGLSVLVFAYLQLYLPAEDVECSTDISLSIDELVCESGVVNFTLSNRGLFTANGAFIRMGDPDRVFKILLNGDDQGLIGDHRGGLPPGESWRASYTYNGTGIQELDVEPFVYIDNQPALCDQAIVTRRVVCN